MIGHAGRCEYRTTWFTNQAYSIHDRCWVFLTQILGVVLIKQHLDLFVRALCHQARRNIFEPDDLLMDDYPAHWGKAAKFYHKKGIQRYLQRWKASV